MYWAQVVTKEILIINQESNEMVEQPAQRSKFQRQIASILGDVQNLPGHSPEESELNLHCFKQV